MDPRTRVPTIDKKDERVYCPYCDMKNHPRWTCHHCDKHRKSNEKHACTLCIGDHPAFLCPLAMCNNGIARRNWEQREKKMAKDDNRKPYFTWYPQGVQPPPPAAQPQGSSSTDGYFWPTSSARSATSRDNPSLCSSRSHASTTSEQLTIDLPFKLRHATTIYGLPEWPRGTCVANIIRSRALPSARRIFPRQLVEHLDSPTGYSWSIGLILATYRNHAVAECRQSYL